MTAITANGQAIGYSGPAGPCLVDGKTGTVLRRFGVGYAENSPVALSGDGRVAAVLKELRGGAAPVEIVNVASGNVIAWASVPTNGAVPTITLSVDSRVLLVHSPKTGALWRFDVP